MAMAQPSLPSLRSLYPTATPPAPPVLPARHTPDAIIPQLPPPYAIPTIASHHNNIQRLSTPAFLLPSRALSSGHRRAFPDVQYPRAHSSASDQRAALDALTMLKTSSAAPKKAPVAWAEGDATASPTGDERSSSKSTHGSVYGDDEAEESTDQKLLKKARRKEQCRVNQANYRKRKRMYEQQLSGCIRSLELEIEELTAQREKISSASQSRDPVPDPEHAIAAFYFMMRDSQRHRDSPRTSTFHTRSLHDLQWAEFESIEQLHRHWATIRRDFATFDLHVKTSERLEASDHVIVKISAELVLTLDAGSELVLPVQQRFEIDVPLHVVSRITSEVDIIAGISSAAGSNDPGAIVRMLRDLEGSSL